MYLHIFFSDEFMEKLDRCKGDGMTEDQCSTAKDIRRRGKNRNAALNCRKRANERRRLIERERINEMQVQLDNVNI